MNHNRHERIIEACDRHPHSEEMLVLKLNTLKRLDESYKTLECAGEILRKNPKNTAALRELLRCMKRVC